MPQNQTLWRFAWLCMDTCRATKNWSCLAHSLQLRSSKTVLSLIVSAFIMVQCPFCRLFGATFFAFLCFLLAISLFKKAPKRRVKVSSRAPTCRKPRTRFTEKTQALDKLGLIVLLARISILMTHQYVLNKVPLHRNTHKTRVCIDRLTKMLT